MQVRLEAQSNPDFGPGTHQRMVRIKPYTVEVDSLEEASRVVEKFIEDNDLGGGNFNFGIVTDNGKEIAWVSYNRKVWATNPYTTKSSDAKEIIIRK